MSTPDNIGIFTHTHLRSIYMHAMVRVVFAISLCTSVPHRHETLNHYHTAAALSLCFIPLILSTPYMPKPSQLSPSNSYSIFLSLLLRSPTSPVLHQFCKYYWYARLAVAFRSLAMRLRCFFKSCYLPENSGHAAISTTQWFYREHKINFSAVCIFHEKHMGIKMFRC
jgi:hypothetical protein